jgi:hypothetical protein
VSQEFVVAAVLEASEPPFNWRDSETFRLLGNFRLSSPIKAFSQRDTRRSFEMAALLDYPPSGSLP